MKLRKFNDFKRIYENNPGLMMEPGEPEELEMSGTTTEQPQIAPPATPVIPEQPKRKVEPNKIEQPSKDPERKAQTPDQAQVQNFGSDRPTTGSYEEEEISSSRIDLMLQDVSNGLKEFGATMQGNVIEVEGNTIDFISELMCFSINGKPMKNLKTAEQVIDFIQSGKHMAQRGTQAQRSQSQAQYGQRMQTKTQTQTPTQAPSLTGAPGGGQRNPVTPGQSMQEKFRRKY